MKLVLSVALLGIAAAQASYMALYSIDGAHCWEFTAGDTSTACFQQFWNDHSYQYDSFHHGRCPAKYNGVVKQDVVCDDWDSTKRVYSTYLEVRSDYLQDEANGIVCTLCETLVSEVDKLVQSEKTKEEIAGVLDSVCGKIPLVGDQCKAIVDDYLGDIIDLIVAQADPQTICKAISLC